MNPRESNINLLKTPDFKFRVLKYKKLKCI